MESSYSKYQLWSPPVLDLSLDSFSTDLIQEFDKTRGNIDAIGKKQVAPAVDEEKDAKATEPVQNESKKAVSIIGIHQNGTLPSPDPSSVTLASERETSVNDEDVSSTANLFRKSSTFLKKKLSQNGGSNKKDENCSIQTTNAEDITNIVSRQYPPKPLQYSPVVEPSSSNHTSIVSSASHVESTLNNKDAERYSISHSITRTSNSNKRASDPISLANSSTMQNSPTSPPAAARTIATTPAVTTASSTPKRRSFFSLRFC